MASPTRSAGPLRVSAEPPMEALARGAAQGVVSGALPTLSPSFLYLCLCLCHAPSRPCRLAGGGDELWAFLSWMCGRAPLRGAPGERSPRPAPTQPPPHLQASLLRKKRSTCLTSSVVSHRGDNMRHRLRLHLCWCAAPPTPPRPGHHRKTEFRRGERARGGARARARRRPRGSLIPSFVGGLPGRGPHQPSVLRYL